MHNLILSILLLVVLAGAIALILKDDIPTVGLNPDGKCQWIEKPPRYEREVCPLKLPERYAMVHVHYDDTKGSQDAYN